MSYNSFREALSKEITVFCILPIFLLLFESAPSQLVPFQVTFKGQILPRFDIAPYAEAFKRSVLPGARRDIVVSLEDVFAGCTKRMTISG